MGGAGQPSGQRWGGVDSSRLVFLRDSAPHSGVLWEPRQSGDLTHVIYSPLASPRACLLPGLERLSEKALRGGRRL